MPPALAQQPRECHYDVLGVDHAASQDEIKKAYRKAALLWHPDKNSGEKKQEAEARFNLISDAYQVLMDPHERAWYDAHREAILMGSDGTTASGFDPTPPLFHLFNASAFSGFGDAEGGFFSVYAQAFEAIAKFEAEQARRDGRDADLEFPPFGNSTTAYAPICKAFYAGWEAFTSKAGFAWVDEYKATDGENRFQRRALDKANDEARQRARKEFSETVRALVSLCKRKDPRVQREVADQARREEERLQEERRKREDKKKEKEKVREELQRTEQEHHERAVEEKAFRLADEDMSSELGSGEEDEEKQGGRKQELPFCHVCEKEFRTEKELDLHYVSKKHREKVAAAGGGDGEEGGAASTMDNSNKKKASPRPAAAKPPRKAKPAVAEVTQRCSSAEAVPSTTCTVCGEAFPSRTKLFDHIRDEDHAQLKEVGVPLGKQTQQQQQQQQQKQKKKR